MLPRNIVSRTQKLDPMELPLRPPLGILDSRSAQVNFPARKPILPLAWIHQATAAFLVGIKVAFVFVVLSSI